MRSRFLGKVLDGFYRVLDGFYRVLGGLASGHSRSWLVGRRPAVRIALNLVQAKILQYPLIKEYALNLTRDLTII